MLEASGWKLQDKKTINFAAGPGIAVKEYQTDIGPADYVLFVDKNAVGVIEAKPESWGQNITTVEDQSAGYAPKPSSNGSVRANPSLFFIRVRAPLLASLTRAIRNRARAPLKRIGF